MPKTPEELAPSGQFENLGAVELVPAPSISETPKTQFSHLGAIQVAAPVAQVANAPEADAGADNE